MNNIVRSSAWKRTASAELHFLNLQVIVVISLENITTFVKSKTVICRLFSQHSSLAIWIETETMVLDCRCGFRGEGGPGARPPTPSFEAPELSISGPCLIFLYFFALLHLAYYFFNILLFCKIQIQTFSNLAFTCFRLLGVHLSLSCF